MSGNILTISLKSNPWHIPQEPKDIPHSMQFYSRSDYNSRWYNTSWRTAL